METASTKMLEKEIVLQEDIMKRNFLNCWMGWGKSTRNFIREVRKEVFLGYCCFIPAQILGPGSVPLFVPHRKRWRGYRPRPWNLLHVSAVRNPCFQFFYKTSAFHINLHNPDYFWCLSFSSKRSYVRRTSIDKKKKLLKNAKWVRDTDIRSWSLNYRELFATGILWSSGMQKSWSSISASLTSAYCLVTECNFRINVLNLFVRFEMASNPRSNRISAVQLALKVAEW